MLSGIFNLCLQGLFSSLRNTLGRRKSRSDLPPPATGASTGGRPPAPAQSSTRNGGSASSRAGVKTSAESLDYVAPSLPSSGSGQSPSRGAATPVGYQSVASAFPSNGTTTAADASRSSAFLPSSCQLPPVSSLSCNAKSTFSSFCGSFYYFLLML